jgi:hypothetical protein
MEYHSDRFKDFSLMVYKDDKIIALLPLNINDGKVYSHQGLTFGGLLVSKKCKFNEVLESFKSILSFLSSEKLEQLHYKTAPKTIFTQPADEIDYLLFKIKAVLTRTDLASTISLQNPLKIQSNRIEGVKKAKKLGLRISEENNFGAFWNDILLPNLEQTHGAKPTHTLEEIEKLATLFPKNIKQFNVYNKETIVGGATIFENDHHIHVQYISGNNDKQRLGSLDFLFHYLITERYKDRMYFDFGTSNENQGTNINEGLMYWKECFGARSIAHNFYTIETKNYKELETVFI